MSLFRKTILTVTGNPLVSSFVSKYGMKLGASRFVAGENMEEALEVVKDLNKSRLLSTLDHLGESVTNRQEAITATQSSLRLFDAIDGTGVQSNVSVKLTQLGLDIDRDFCLENMNLLTAKAKEKNTFVRIDMEDSPRIDDTLFIFDRLLENYDRNHVGAVIQSYLLRSEEDVKRLGEKKVNLRIVKGAYKEPKEVAFQKKQDVDENYIKLVQTHLKNGCYTAIATHDEKMISSIKSWIETNHISDDLYEFQMLYGIRTDLQEKLIEEGYTVRIYIPYGQEWYPYFTRRIAERPANALFVLRNLQRRK
jgi:proline dehydrogenase